MKEILDLFGDASGHVVNLQKCTISLIHCEGIDVEVLASYLPCRVARFPCTYLGLPLTPVAFMKADLQPLVDPVANKWAISKSSLLFQTDRLTLIKTVLTTLTIYHMSSLHIPPWVFKAITKICLSFFWRGSEETK